MNWNGYKFAAVSLRTPFLDWKTKNRTAYLDNGHTRLTRAWRRSLRLVLTKDSITYQLRYALSLLPTNIGAGYSLLPETFSIQLLRV